MCMFNVVLFNICDKQSSKLEFSLAFELFSKFADIFNKLSLRHWHCYVQNTLRHPALGKYIVTGERRQVRGHLVVTVHQPEEVTELPVRGWCHHLTPRTIVSPHNLTLGWGILELHALTAHHEGGAVVALLGDIDEVPGRHHPSATVAGHLECLMVTLFCPLAGPLSLPGKISRSLC